MPVLAPSQLCMQRCAVHLCLKIGLCNLLGTKEPKLQVLHALSRLHACCQLSVRSHVCWTCLYQAAESQHVCQVMSMIDLTKIHKCEQFHQQQLMYTWLT